MNWQPIETAPKDGTRVMLTNGELFGAGHLVVNIGSPETHDMARWRREYAEWQLKNEIPDPKYNGLFNKPKPDAAPMPEMHMIPNPKAGERDEWWYVEGCSPLIEGADCEDDEGRSKNFKPTHWMPLPAPPSK